MLVKWVRCAPLPRAEVGSGGVIKPNVVITVWVASSDVGVSGANSYSSRGVLS